MSDTKDLSLLGNQETQYSYDDPQGKRLETFDYEAKSLQVVTFFTDEFTSLCPKTGQPDFANITITYVPRELGVESKSLKLYLFAYRNHGSFHEDCINKIMTDIKDKVDPYFIRVVGDFTRRGGISIKPISMTYSDDADEDMKDTIYDMVCMTDHLKYER